MFLNILEIDDLDIVKVVKTHIVSMIIDVFLNAPSDDSKCLFNNLILFVGKMKLYLYKLIHKDIADYYEQLSIYSEKNSNEMRLSSNLMST